MIEAPPLSRARAALDRGDVDEALRALLEAWRATRSPRVAEVIDRVSVEVTAKRPFVANGGVAQRTAAVVAALGREDPLELGALLAQPWPGRWQDAEILLDALCAQPADPRIAASLARLIDTAPYDSYRTGDFYRRLLLQLQHLADARVVPLLESARQRPRSRYFAQVANAIGSTITHLQGQVVAPLSTEETEDLSALEGRFAGERARQSASRRSEEELLAAIAATPDDLALRQVYADFLVERGDPRGEHIALGLLRHAGRDTPATRRKEEAIAKKHGARWIGALDQVLAPEGRVFDCGFLVEATLQLAARKGRLPEQVPEALRDPALGSVRRLHLGTSFHTAEHAKLLVDILGLPTLANLTGLYGLGNDGLVALGREGPRPRLRALGVTGLWGEDARELLRGGELFPGLVDLTLYPNLEWFLSSPAARRLERLVVPWGEGTWAFGSVREAVERAGLPLVELVFTGDRGVEHPWTFTLRRDAEGRFSSLTARPDRVPSDRGFERALETFADGTLLRIEVVDHERCKWDMFSEYVAERQLARFPGAVVQVPWARS
ncbi:MAG: TIGR02996 domain-containing protein [Myxococcales bacterium]|nr:TIGR02996 domain-containing protein [Myxococcales bacterium]